MAGKLAGVIPTVPAAPPVADLLDDDRPDDGLLPDDDLWEDDLPERDRDGDQQGDDPDGVVPAAVRTGPSSRVSGLAAAAPAPADGASVFVLPAGYNLPTPGPFARNRQRVGRRFGEVVVTQGALILRVRRKRVGQLLPPVRLLPADLRLVSPTETDFMGNNRGIVLERADGEHVYVWVDEPTPLLTVLSIHGFVVGEDPVPVTRAG